MGGRKTMQAVPQMRDLFLEDDVDMAQATEIPGAADAAQEIRDAIVGHQVCPFCGVVRDDADGPCPRCTMENSSTSRAATKSRIGPWYVLQARNPAAPGMRFETLLGFVRKGRVKPRTIVRGPTTHQLWRFAAHVKGLSREFGICYSCGGEIERTATLCSHCNRLQEPPPNPDIFLEGELSGPGTLPIYRQVGNAPPATEGIGQHEPGRERPQGPGMGAPSPVDSSRPQRKAADGFLSAQDLAAAFKLDFQPKAHHGRRTPTSSAAAQGGRRGRSTSRRPRRWGRRVALVTLLAAAVAGGYYINHDPALRAQAADAYGKTLVWGKQRWAELQKPAPKAQRPPSRVMDFQIQSSDASSTGPQSGTPQTQASQPSPWDRLYQTNPPSAPKKAEPAATDPAAPANRDTPPSPPPAAAARQDVPPPPPSQPINKPHREGGIDDVRTLYRTAIDAEAQGDYAAAVASYEQIKQFPQDLWPRDLDLRLRQARRPAR